MGKKNYFGSKNSKMIQISSPLNNFINFTSQNNLNDIENKKCPY